MTMFIFEHKGRQFVARVHRDEDMMAPWDEHDGHGPVRLLGRNESKRPGEVLMGRRYAYGWAEALVIAERDGWNAEPYDAPNRAERAVRADFERLSAWLRDDWHWVGISVAPLGPDGEVPEETYDNALWGIESDSPDYHREVAAELADQIK
jgi:hypothetical protein